MKYTRFFVFTLIAALTVVAAIGTALAAKAAGFSWSANAVGTLASSAMDWDSGAVPVSGEDITLPAGSTVVWDMPGIVPSSLTSSADLSLSSPLIISGNLDLAGGSFKLNGQPLNVGGDLLMSAGTLDAGAASMNISGNWTCSGGTTLLTADTVTMNGGNKTIASGGQHFGNLTIALANGSASLRDSLNVDGALTVTAGTLAIGSQTATVTGGVALTGGSLTAGAGTLVLSGSIGRPLNVSGGAFTVDPSSTVEYRRSTGSVSIEPVVYGNLTLTGGAIFSLAGDTTVAGTLTVGAGAVLNLGGHALGVPSGRLANLGNISDGVIHAPALGLTVLDAGGAEISSIKTSSGTITVRVQDQTMNRNAAVRENFPTALTITTVDGDQETVALQETAPGSGVFLSAALVVHQGTATTDNNQLEIGQNDIVFVKFTDPQDQGNIKTVQLAVALANNAASGQPQIVDGPQIGAWSSMTTGSGTTYAAHIVWNTDALSTSAVTVTSNLLTTPITAGSLAGTTNHDVAVAGLLRGHDYAFTVSSVTADGKTVASASQHFTVIVSGDRIKAAKDPAVYWYLGNQRNVFPDPTAYGSWFPDFTGVVTVPPEQLAGIPLGHIVPIRAGTYLVKIQSDPKTYAVEPFGVLRWVPNEAQAVALYGVAWSKRVRDVDVSQFVNYSVGDALGANELPSGFVYTSGGSEMSVAIGKTAHPLSETYRALNGIALKFVSSVAPSLAASLASGGAVNGYDPDLNGVYKDGVNAVLAPAFGG